MKSAFTILNRGPAVRQLLGVVSGLWIPIASNLFGPASVAFPGIQGGIDANTTAFGCRRFRNPLAVVLPTVGIICGRLGVICRWLGACHRLVSLARRRIRVRCVPVGPLEVFAVWHCIALLNPLDRCYVAKCIIHRNCITIANATFRIIFSYLSTCFT